MNPLRHKPSGETITETIIALTIMAIGITMAGVLIASSLRNITGSKNRVVAVNIAREGVEAVRAIRDTNWLKFSAKRRQCWNHLPADLVSGVETCTGAANDLIKPDATGTVATKESNWAPQLGTDQHGYIVYKDNDSRWRLAPHTFTKDVSGNVVTDNAQLFYVDIDSTRDSDSDGNKTNDHDMFNNTKAPGYGIGPLNALGNPLGTGFADVTEFKRVILISYLTNDGTAVITNGALDDTINRMVVTCIVTWSRGGVDYKVELTTHLTDYLGRDSLSN